MVLNYRLVYGHVTHSHTRMQLSTGIFLIGLLYLSPLFDPSIARFAWKLGALDTYREHLP